VGILQAATRATAGLAIALAAAGATPSFGQSAAAATYPASRSLADISSWLRTDTPLLASQVVDIGPSAVTAITASAPLGQPRGFTAQVSAETLDPTIGAQDMVLSWSIPVEVDCDRRVVRLGAMTGYPVRDLHTSPRVVRDPDPDWVGPSPIAPLGAVMRALCDRDFKRPLLGGPFRQTAAAKPPKAVAKAPEPTSAPTPEPVVASTPKPQPTPKPAAAPKAGPAVAGLAVQVGASPSQPDAKGLMGKVQKKFAADLGGLSTDVVSAQVDGKTVYRAVITGFHVSSEARALCEKLKAGGQACFVRR
jgi:cell division septation protein DedD